MAGPTLLDRCTWAATGREARFRIRGHAPQGRASCLVGLDRGVVDALSKLSCSQATRTLYATGENSAETSTSDGGLLQDPQGRLVGMDEAFRDIDLVVMLASTQAASSAAARIFEETRERAVALSVFILGDDAAAVAGSVRPYAHMVLVGVEDDELDDLLLALRA